MLKWFRTAGVGAELFGWGGLVLAGWFWTAVGFIYCGFALLALDLWFEPGLKNKIWGRFVGLAIIGALATIFTFGIVLLKAPIGFYGISVAATYPAGQVVSGIPWRQEFVELNVSLSNPTEIKYEDLNLVIRPSFPVAAIKQVGNICDASIEDAHSVFARQLLKEKLGDAKVNPLVLLATDAGYRVRCAQLPANSALKLVMAIVDMRWNPPLLPDVGPDGGLSRPDYVLRLRTGDFTTYWYGHPEANVYIREKSAQSVHIEGQYKAMYRTRTIAQNFSVQSALP